MEVLNDCLANVAIAQLSVMCKQGLNHWLIGAKKFSVVRTCADILPNEYLYMKWSSNVVWQYVRKSVYMYVKCKQIRLGEKTRAT